MVKECILIWGATDEMVDSLSPVIPTTSFIYGITHLKVGGRGLHTRIDVFRISKYVKGICKGPITMVVQSED